MDVLLRPASIVDVLWGALSLRGFATIVGLWVAYRIAVALYNISPFHPLSRFPGPKIAAASYLYEAYYDWILVGRYGKEIKRMHDKYGASGYPKQARAGENRRREGEERETSKAHQTYEMLQAPS